MCFSRQFSHALCKGRRELGKKLPEQVEKRSEALPQALTNRVVSLSHQPRAAGLCHYSSAPQGWASSLQSKPRGETQGGHLRSKPGAVAVDFQEHNTGQILLLIPLLKTIFPIQMGFRFFPQFGCKLGGAECYTALVGAGCFETLREKF